MGILFYGASRREIHVNDRLLAHAQIVIFSKLRRRESFSLTWRKAGATSGVSAVWLSDSIPLEFEYEGAEAIVINRHWIDALNSEATSSPGLTFVPEPHV